MRRVIATALIATALGYDIGAATAQETGFKRVGATEIIAVHNPDRTLHRCLADVQSPSGTLRVHNFPNGQWAASVPGLGLPGGSKQIASFNLNGNVAFKSPPTQVQTVTFELQNDRGWRITDIKYGPDHTLLGSLTGKTP